MNIISGSYWFQITAFILLVAFTVTKLLSDSIAVFTCNLRLADAVFIGSGKPWSELDRNRIHFLSCTCNCLPRQIYYRHYRIKQKKISFQGKYPNLYFDLNVFTSYKINPGSLASIKSINIFPHPSYHIHHHHFNIFAFQIHEQR